MSITIKKVNLFLTPVTTPHRRYNPPPDAIPVSAENKLFFDVETEGLFQSKTILGLAYNNNGDYWVLGCDNPTNINDYQKLFDNELKSATKIYLMPIDRFFDYVYRFDGILVGGNPLFDLSRGATDWKLTSKEPTLYRDSYRILSKPMGYGRKVIKEKIGKKGKRIKNSTKAVLDVLQITGAILGVPKLSLDGAGKGLNTQHQKQDYDTDMIACNLNTLKYLLYDVLTTRDVYFKAAQIIPEDAFPKLFSGASIGKMYYERMNIVQPKMELTDKHAAYEAYFGGRSEVNYVGLKSTTLLTNLDFFSFYPNIQIQLDLMRFTLAVNITTRHRLDLIPKLESIQLNDLKNPNLWRDLSGIIVKIKAKDVRLPVRITDKDGNINNSIPFVTSTEPLYYTVFDYFYAKLYNEMVYNHRGHIQILDVIEYVAEDKQEDLKGTNVFGCNTKPETFFYDLLKYRLDLKKALKRATDSKEIERLKSYIYGVKIILNSTSYGITIERNETKTDTYIEYDTSNGEAKSRYRLAEGWYTVPIVGAEITGAARLLSGICELIEFKHTNHGFYEVDTDGFVVESAEEIRAFWDRWRLFPNKDFLEYDEEPHTYYYGISPKRYIKIKEDGTFWTDGTKEHSLGSYILGKDNPKKLREKLITLGLILKTHSRDLTPNEYNWLKKPVLTKLTLTKSAQLISLNEKGLFPRPYSFAWKLVFNYDVGLLCIFNTKDIDNNPKPNLIIQHEKPIPYDSVKEMVWEYAKTRFDVAKHYFESNPHKYELPKDAKGWMKIPHITIQGRQYITKTGNKGILNVTKDEIIITKQDKKLAVKVKKEQQKRDNKILINKVKEVLGISLNEMVVKGLIPNKHYLLTTKERRALRRLLKK